VNSRGWDLANRTDMNDYVSERAPFAEKLWRSSPITVRPVTSGTAHRIFNPALTDSQVGEVIEADQEQAIGAIAEARIWSASVAERAAVLRKAADLYEQHHGEIFALLAREAGKTQFDTIAELREAVDFLRYYAKEAEKHPEGKPRGIIACISPWNFPLAIFTGQVAAALAAGNAVLAKPADQTPLIAALATNLLHEAGVPLPALQLLPGPGATVGAAISGDERINGVCFTGSTATAQTIHRNIAENGQADSLLIAETGGLNCMIADSTALPEQTVRDIITSAFQSAGQRCSALRVLYLQKDIAEPFLNMLKGAMHALELGNPWWLSTDIGPVIDQAAHDKISAHIATASREGRLLMQLDGPDDGYFVGPAVIKVGGINDLEEEIFGPVLHVATYEHDELDQVIRDINNRGYGLTFGLQTRIERRIDKLTRALKVGNIYVNRNQVGAVVGSQPFGGEGLSGTGPKAGGPHYLPRFYESAGPVNPVHPGQDLTREVIQDALDKLPAADSQPRSCEAMPGPTGESNELFTYARGKMLCLGPTAEDAARQAEKVRLQGCEPLLCVPGASGEQSLDGFVPRALLSTLTGMDGVICWSDIEDIRAIRKALAGRDGALIPLITEENFDHQCLVERHVCIDTTAAGGNVSLLT